MSSERAVEKPPYEIIIEPRRQWLQIPWRDLWEYRDLLILLVRRDFVSKYKQTLLGPAWFVIQPLIMTAMFTLIFGRIGRVESDNIPYPLFSLCNLLGWTYFAQNISTGASTFTANAHLFGKVYFPRLVVPISVVLSNLLAFVIQLVPFFAFYAYYKLFMTGTEHLHLSWAALLIPLLVLQIALFSLGVSLWMAASTAKYRDLSHLTQFIVQLWMFATIIYPISQIPERLQWIAWANPMAPILEAMRIVLLGPGTISVALMAVSVVITLVTLLTGILVFQRTERTIVDHA